MHERESNMFQPDQVICQHSDGEEHYEESGVITKPEELIKEPSMYKVFLHNDDYTPMDFVVEILEDFFNKQTQEAHDIMLEVHNKGMGAGGIFPREIAETKLDLVHRYANECDYPLKCTLEEQT